MVFCFIVRKDIRILLLEDDVQDAELVRYALAQGGVTFMLARVDSEEQFLSQMEQLKPDIVLFHSCNRAKMDRITEYSTHFGYGASQNFSATD